MSDELTPEERAAFESLPRERMPAGLEAKVPARADVELVGDYQPTFFRFKKNEEWKPGVKPSQLK